MVGVLLRVVGGGGDGGTEVAVGVVEAGFAMGDQTGDMRGRRGGRVGSQDTIGKLLGGGEIAGREQLPEVGVFGGAVVGGRAGLGG